MASIDILRTEDDSSDSVQSGEYSMLNEVEVIPYENGVASQINFDLTNMHSTINETAYDGNAEVNSQISKLISNNLSMKEALDKSNSMMREQLNSLPSIIESKVKLQKQNLQKAIEENTALKRHNEILQNKLDSMLNMSQRKDDFCVKCETLNESANILFNVEDFNKIDDEMLSSEMKTFQANLDQNLMTISQHFKKLLKSKMDKNEKKVLKTFIYLLAYKIGNFNGIIQTDEETGYEIIHQEVKQNGSVNGFSHDSSETQQLLKNLEERLESKEDEIISLKKENDQLSETVKAYRLKIQDFEKELHLQLENMKVSESSDSEKYKQRCENLQQQLCNNQEKLDAAKMSENQIIQKLLQENQNLKESIIIEQQAYQNIKDELSKIMLNKEKLQAENDRVLQLLEIENRDAKIKVEKILADKQKSDMEKLETIDHLTAQLFEAQDKYAESERKNVELSLKVDGSQNESETITILKQQIEVYKKDYEISEMKKQSIQYEMEKLSYELKTLKENSESRKASPSSSRRFSSNALAENSAVVACECPVCGAGFTSIKATENHVNRCLNKPQKD